MPSIKPNKKPDAHNLVQILILLIFVLFCLLPFAIIISASFSNETRLVKEGYSLIPRGFDLTAYEFILRDASLVKRGSNIAKSFVVSVSVTVTGALGSTFLIALMAYPLSRRHYRLKNALSFYVFFIMLFNGGIVPWYLVCTKVLHLRDNFLALVVPYLFNAWFLLLLRNFFKKIPDSLEESAKIDGAGNFRIFFTIMLPLALPGVATIGLFSTLRYWNDWWLGLMLINDDRFVSLQLYLTRIMQNIEFLKSSDFSELGNYSIQVPAETVRMAICTIVILPILFVYPFFQRYFIQGLTVGAIKG